VSLLEVKDLNICIESSAGPVKIVSGLDLDIPSSTVFGLAGESGCGKSLTALSIMGILPPNMSASGEINFRGVNLLDEDPESLRALRGREISMIFQEPMTSLNPVLKVGYQIREVLTTHLKVSGKEADRITLGLLRSVRISAPEHRAKEYPHQMSGGMRQRIMMAMAIACGPSLLIADEPTTALDVTIQAQILELIGSLKEEQQMSVLLITHDLGVIAENASMAAIMYAGRLVEVANVEDLFGSPGHPYTVGLLDSLPRERDVKLKPITGSVPKPGSLPKGCKFSNRCGMAIADCMVDEPELMNVNGAEGKAGNGFPHLVRCIRSEELRNI
jgi:oligopeptide/dipeptide ABC transporter ATP-binding protein